MAGYPSWYQLLLALRRVRSVTKMSQPTIVSPSLKRKLEEDGPTSSKILKQERDSTRRGGPRARVFTVVLRGTHDEIVEKLQEYNDKTDWYVGQDEIGEAGNPHAQITFGFTNPRSLNAIQTLLPDGANIQIVRNAVNSIKYCTDENKRSGETYFNGDVPQFSKSQNAWSNELYADALAKGSFNAAMSHIEQTDLTTYILHHKKLFAYFENKFAEGDKSRFKPEDFNRPLLKLPTKRTLVLIGPTGMGKTQFALAHFQHPLRVTNKQDWTRFKEGVTDGIVLDDVHFNTWQPNTILHTLDVENAVTQDVKYSSVRVPAGIPRIVCINSEAELFPEGIAPEKKAAILRRLEIVRITDPLFNTV